MYTPDFRFSVITSDFDLFTRSDRRLSERKKDSCTLSTAPLLEGGPISVLGSEDGVVTHLVAALNISRTPRSCIILQVYDSSNEKSKNEYKTISRANQQFSIFSDDDDDDDEDSEKKRASVGNE